MIRFPDVLDVGRWRSRPYNHRAIVLVDGEDLTRCLFYANRKTGVVQGMVLDAKGSAQSDGNGGTITFERTGLVEFVQKPDAKPLAWWEREPFNVLSIVGHRLKFRWDVWQLRRWRYTLQAKAWWRRVVLGWDGDA